MKKQKLKKPLLGLLMAVTLVGASSALAKEIDVLSVPFELTLVNEENGYEKTHSFTLSELGVTLKEAEEDELVGRSLNNLLANLFIKHDYEFSWTPARTEGLLRIAYDIDRPFSSQFIQTELGLEIQAEQMGYEWDTEEIMEEILDDAPYFDDYRFDITEPELVQADELAAFQEHAQALLDQGFTVHISEDESYTFPAQAKDMLISRDDSGAIQFSLNEPYLNYIISTLEGLVNQEAKNIVVYEASLEGTGKISFEGELQDGRSFNSSLSLATIKKAFDEGQVSAWGITAVEPGKIVNQSGLPELDNLELIASGVSNFHHSTSSRVHNVKASMDQMNGVLIPAGQDFYFNSFLDPSEWVYGYVILGNEAVPGLGGGTCQVSTTVGRALENAGLPTHGYAHSWYLDEYYAAKADGSLDIEGVGRDTTIYLGGKNLVATNTTSSPILMFTSTDDEYNAHVYLFGIDDRYTQWTGPITRSNMTDEAIAQYGSIGYNQVLWKVETVYLDGRPSEVDWKLSSYAKGYVDQFYEAPQTYTY